MDIADQPKRGMSISAIVQITSQQLQRVAADRVDERTQQLDDDHRRGRARRRLGDPQRIASARWAKKTCNAPSLAADGCRV
jgi:hypothetical protein